MTVARAIEHAHRKLDQAIGVVEPGDAAGRGNDAITVSSRSDTCATEEPKMPGSIGFAIRRTLVRAVEA